MSMFDDVLEAQYEAETGKIADEGESMTPEEETAFGKAVGEAIRKRRLERGMKYSELAKLAMVTVWLLKEVEGGKIDRLTLARAMRIAEQLSCSVELFVSQWKAKDHPYAQKEQKT